MAELTPKERLQPSLLDRLTDDEPKKTVESREQRVLSIERLHDCIVRDLSWLLNSENFVIVEKDEKGKITAMRSLDEFPEYGEAAASTVNYGIPSLSGQVIAQLDQRQLEEAIRESILRFEPRLLAQSVKVRATLDDSGLHHNSLRFQIEAAAWAQPVPLQLLVTAEVDLETGNFSVVDR